jgi:predicted protein tyrosine phosphatase
VKNARQSLVFRRMFVLPKDGAVVACQRYPDWPLISIFDDDGPLQIETTGPRLELQMDDFSRLLRADGSPLVDPARTEFTYPDPRHASAIVEFAEGLTHDHGGLAIHCAAGISRSSATAIGVLSVLLGAGRERECMDRVRQAARRAELMGWRTDHAIGPNGRLVGLLDHRLKRGGALVDAYLERWNRKGRTTADILADAAIAARR